MPPRTCTAVFPLRDAGLAREELRGARRGRDVTGALVVEDGRGRVRCAARELDAHVHVREQVLDRLERTDRHTELAALEGVRRRDVERALRRADELGRGEDRPGPAQPKRVLGPAAATPLGRAE